MRGEAYPKYRPSGVEWLGEVPEHWEVKAIKWTTPVLRGASPRPIDDPVYFDEDGEYAWVRIADVTASSIFLEETTQWLSEIGSSLSVKLQPGALFLSIAATVGVPCITKIKCCIHDGFVYFPRSKSDTKFMYYIFACGEPYKGLGKMGTQLNLNTDTVGSIVMGFPPLPEQQAIAAFLDSETVRIDALIGKKQKLVELLKEKRTALISRAVTKGLDAKVKMKPSGVEWLGEVPEHWEVRRIKYISTIFGRIGFRGYTTDDLVDEMDGAITLSPSNMIDGKFDYSKCTYISWEKYEESPEIKVQSGDVIIVKTGSTLGKVAIVENVPHQMTINPQLAIFKSVKSDRKFLFYFVGSPYIQELVSISNTGGTIPTMTQTTIGNYPIPLPPLPEQEAIAAFLDSETAKIDALVSKVDTAIEKLKEYRTALISAAVTGKIDIST